MAHKSVLRVLPLFLVLILFGWVLESQARIDLLELKRIVIINQLEVVVIGDLEPVNIPGVGHDSRVEGPRPQGTLSIETDDRNIVRGMVFEAWHRGINQPIVDDWVIVLDYVSSGGRYEVMSLWTNRQYYITFIRREGNHSGNTASIIFLLDLDDDSTVLLDYQYPE